MEVSARKQLNNEKKPGCLEIILPSSVGIIINHYKDILRIPIKQPGFNGSKARIFFFVAQLNFWETRS